VNNIYRIVWSAATGRWVVASELATRSPRQAGRRRLGHRPLVLALGMSLLGVATAHAESLDFPASATVDIGSGTRHIDGLTVANGASGSIVGAGGTLVHDGADFRVGGTARSTEQNLDMGGLSNFVFDGAGNVFSVSGRATGGAANTTGISNALVNLAGGTNVITAASFGVADVSRSVQGPATNQATLRLGQDNIVNADVVTIGTNQTNGILNFQDGVSNGTLRLRGTDGSTAVSSWDIAAGSNSNYSGTVGTVDLSAGTLDAKVDALTIATSRYGTQPAVGTLTMGAGLLDANTILLGQRNSTIGGGGTTARLIVGAGGVVQAGAVTLGDRTGTTGTVNASVNLTGGALRADSVLAGAGAATRAINFDDGVLGNRAEGRDSQINVPIVLASTGTHTFQVEGAGALMTVSGLVSGANGTLRKAGDGVLALTGTNTYTGGTTVNEGLIRFQSAANLGSGQIVLDGGGLQWASGTTTDISARLAALGRGGAVLDVQDNDVTLASAMSGADGALIKRGDGVLTLAADNTYTGVTRIEQGELVLGTGGNAGSIAGDVANDARLTVNRSDTATLAGAMRGSGELVQAGSGTLVLTGMATHTGGTVVSAGVLQLGDGGSTGNLLGDVRLGAGTALRIQRDDALLLEANVTGEGALVQAGAGTTVVAGDLQHGGGTRIEQGALRLGNGGITGSVQGDIHNDGMLEFDRADDRVLTNAVQGTGGLVQMGQGTLRIADDQAYTGDTRVLAGRLQVDGSIQSSTWVAAAGTLGGGGAIHGDVNNAGVIVPGSGSDYGILTVHGDYVGNGGALVLNTYLDTDGSPSSQLVIDGGRASGTTQVRVNNARGSEGHTTGDGILVIATENGGTTDRDAFRLGYPARSGALGYELFRGDLEGHFTDNWYLRNSFVVPLPMPEPTVPVDPVDPVHPTDPTDPTSPIVPVDPVMPIDPVVPGPSGPDPVDNGDPVPVLPVDPIDVTQPLPPGTYPIIGPELATYGTVQPIARELGLLNLGTMRERGPADVPAGASEGRAAWARVTNRHVDNAYRAFAAPQARGDLSGLQVGTDLWQHARNDGQRSRVSGYLAHSRSSVRVDGVFTNDDATGYVRGPTGSLDLRATSAGLGWTLQGQGGGYLDAVVQGTRYSGSAHTGAMRLPIRGEGHALSVEVGQSFAMPLTHGSFVLEPQLQAIWQQVDIKHTADAAGTVDLGTTRGITGRMGVRGAWVLDAASGTRWSPYVGVNYWHDPRASSQVTYAGRDQVPLESGGGRVEMTLGMEVQLRGGWGLFGSGGYQRSTGADDDQQRDSVNASLGMQYRW
jgi:outer membrane autotransporter protein